MAEFSLVLGVGGVTETVDVVGESPIVDTSSSSTDNALSQDMLFNLPIRPTNAATGLLNYVPGVNDGSAYGGNADYGNGLLIDGVDTRDPDAGSSWVFFNFNLVEEVQVGGLGANAEYGAYTGAVVNTVTKSGGNRYAGLFDAYWTSTDFSADNVKPEYIAQNATLKQPYIVNKRLDLTAQLGGPLIKNKLFFFVAAQRYEQKDDPSGPPDAAHRDEPARQRQADLAAGAQRQPDGQLPVGLLQPDGADLDQLRRERRRPDAQPGLAGGGVGPAVAAPLRHPHVHGAEVQRLVGLLLPRPQDQRPPVLRRLHERVLGWLVQLQLQRPGTQPDQRLDLALRRGLRQARPQVRRRDRAQQGAQPVGYNQGIYYYDYTEYYPKGQYSPTTYNYDTDGRNERESLYAQDSWKPTERLTINAGVRVDFVRGRSPVLDKTVYSNTNWAPRLGFAFDLTGDGKTVLKGHYGQYYEGIFNSMYARAPPGLQRLRHLPLRPGRRRSAGPLGNCFTEDRRLPYPVYGSTPTSSTPGSTSGRSGLERELRKDFRLSVTGIWREDKNVQGSVYPDARWTQTTVTAGRSGRSRASTASTSPSTTGRTGPPRRTTACSRTPRASSTATRRRHCSAPPGPSASTRA